MIHFTTFVLPAEVLGLPYDTPFLVLGGDQAQDVPTLPLLSSLHRIDNEVMGYVHVTPAIGPIPVADAWVDAVRRYDDTAKVVLLRQPMPGDIATTWAERKEGVHRGDLPPWVGDLLEQRLAAGVRDVGVSSGADPLSIMVDVGVPGTWPDWAEVVIPGQP